MLPARRAVAFALLATLALPLAAAQEVPEPAPPTTPSQVACQPPVETCLPDLIATNPQAEATDERFPVAPCADFLNLGEAPTATPFRYLLIIDEVGVAEKQVTGAYRTGEGDTVCWGEFHLAPGHHTMEVRIDSANEVAETNENNNARRLAFSVGPAPKVDLHLSSLRVTPTQGGVGQNQYFHVNVSNSGTGGSPLALLSLEDDTGPLANWTVPRLERRDRKSVV